MEGVISPISDDGSATSAGSAKSRKRSAASTNQGPYRSVVDYDTEEQLFEALMLFMDDDIEHNQSCSAQMTSLLTDIREGEPVQTVAGSAELQTELAKGMDWVLPAFNTETSFPQSLEVELKRLQVLKSYLVLDSKSEEAFERITNLAARIFDAPFSIVSLVDLGRNFFMSNFGFKTMDPEARDIPRKFAFCTQTLQNKENILVVPDATKDFRFADNPFVTSPPFVKFYAGAPLITPEGYKLGTICILDTEARPHGLSLEQLNTLGDLADMTVKVMVDRRYQLNKKKSKEGPTQKFTYTAHDLMAPLLGIHASLSILKDDSVVKEVLGEHQFELLRTASSCSELIIRICKDAIEGLNPSGSKFSTFGTNFSLARNEVSQRGVPLTNVQDLVKSLQMIAEPIAKVPCIVTLDKALPNAIVADDLKLFRSTVNLLTNAIERTSAGMVHLSIRRDDTVVLFECEDTGEDIPVDEYQFLFQPGGDAASVRVGLSSIASLIESLEGEYGFRPRDGYSITNSSGRRRSGSIFWFSIPLILPEMLDKSQRGTVSLPTMDGPVDPVDTSHQVGVAWTDVPSTSGTTALNDGSSVSNNFDREAQMTQMDHPSSKWKVTSGELVKLASDLDVPLSDLEPVPLNGLMGGISSNDVRRRRALVIDDSVVVRRSLVHTLNCLGFEVIQADDGEEGLKELQQSLFDLVLCEFSMPVMDGITCVRLYRAWEKVNRPWDSQLIVGISALPRANDNSQGQHAGMNAFLPKPLTIKTITDLQCCSEAVQRTRQLDAWERKGHPTTTPFHDPKSAKTATSEFDFPSSLT